MRTLLYKDRGNFYGKNLAKKNWEGLKTHILIFWQVLMYLKGIGNFGKFDDGIHAALQTCIDTNDRNEIRVAAIEAYR